MYIINQVDRSPVSNLKNYPDKDNIQTPPRGVMSRTLIRYIDPILAGKVIVSYKDPTTGQIKYEFQCDCADGNTPTSLEQTIFKSRFHYVIAKLTLKIISWNL